MTPEEHLDGIRKVMEHRHRRALAGAAGEFWSYMWPVVIVSVVISVVFVALIFGSAALQCHDIAEQTGLASRYSLWSGCYVQVGGKWIPRETWREVSP